MTDVLLRSNLPLAKSTAEKQWGHARGCKKTIEECRICRTAITWFATLPLSVLSKVLEQRQPPPLVYRGRDEEKTK